MNTQVKCLSDCQFYILLGIASSLHLYVSKSHPPQNGLRSRQIIFKEDFLKIVAALKLIVSFDFHVQMLFQRYSFSHSNQSTEFFISVSLPHL